MKASPYGRPTFKQGVTIVRLSRALSAQRMSLRSGATKSCSLPDQGAHHVTVDLLPAISGQRDAAADAKPQYLNVQLTSSFHIRCFAYR